MTRAGEPDAPYQPFVAQVTQEVNALLNDWQVAEPVVRRLRGVAVVKEAVLTDDLDQVSDEAPCYHWRKVPQIMLKKLSSQERPTELAALLLLDAMQHPNIVSVATVNGHTGIYHDEDDNMYLAMTKVEGTTLGDFVNDASIIGNERKVFVVTQLASVLAYLEYYKLQHGDLHKWNIMLTPQDQVILIDVARLGTSTEFASDLIAFYGHVTALFGSSYDSEDRAAAPASMLPLMQEAEDPKERPADMASVFRKHVNREPYVEVMIGGKRMVLPYLAAGACSEVFVVNTEWLYGSRTAGVGDYLSSSSAVMPGVHTLM